MGSVASAQRPSGELLPAPEIDLRRSARIGLIGAISAIFFAVIGFIVALDGRILFAGDMSAGDVFFLALVFVPAYIASKPPPVIEGYERPEVGFPNALAGLIAGTITCLGLMLLVGSLGSVSEEASTIRRVFPNVTIDLVDYFGRGFNTDLLVAGITVGVLAAAFHAAPIRLRRAINAAVGWLVAFGLLQIMVGQIFDGVGLEGARGWFYRVRGGLTAQGTLVVGLVAFGAYLARGVRDRASIVERQLSEAGKGKRRILWVVGVIALLGGLSALPQVLGTFLSSVLVLAGVFLLMALGLNIVIGYAGLLDLGYVAFFAVGAYTTAVLTSPSSPRWSPELTFWAALPFVVLAAAVAGLIVGAPVLRLRGDYLAIVTLGFGEIARLIVQSDWQGPNFGGAQGIARISTIEIGGFEFGSAQEFAYLIFAAALVFTYISWALQNSRIGRAWMAMREDESVAEALGVNIVVAKLWAFVIGAAFASIGGALFAHRLTTVYPHSFNILVSITVVVIVIVGGMGSVPGVIVAALVLIGLPEFLREFEEYKFLIYGILLIYMMLQRPEGFIPSKRRGRELMEEEQAQDVWLKAQEEEKSEVAAS